jgi:hypothetical protein
VLKNVAKFSNIIFFEDKFRDYRDVAGGYGDGQTLRKQYAFTIFFVSTSKIKD